MSDRRARAQCSAPARARAPAVPREALKVVVRVAPEGWEVPRDSFFQNNFFLLPELVRVVRASLRDSGSRFLVDAYCGVGFFSIELADLVERFVGMELDAPAVKAARTNAAVRQRHNGEFRLGATEELLAGLLPEGGTDTTVLLDPPRVGCPPRALAALRDARPAQILYVSCHPATLARDLNKMCHGGVFEVKQVTPLDMFPQTQHVECVADVRRRAERDCA